MYISANINICARNLLGDFDGGEGAGVVLVHVLEERLAPLLELCLPSHKTSKNKTVRTERTKQDSQHGTNETKQSA